jgi:hypothetical protein
MYLKSQVEPACKMAGKLFSFIHIHQMARPWYLSRYVQGSVMGDWEISSNFKFGHTHATHTIA